MTSIVVKTLDGRTLAFQTDKSTTVAQLKSMIQDSDGVPPEHQIMVYDGRQLEDDQPLSSYGVQDGSEIHLILRLSGN